MLAVRILAALAVHPDGLVSSDHLGGVLAANPVVVRRLLVRLKWQGLVETRRGVGGGYALARDPATITLGRVHRALHDADSEPTEPAFASADAAYVNELDRWTVAQVMEAFPESRRNNESYKSPPEEEPHRS